MIKQFQTEALWEGQLKQASRTDTDWPIKALVVPIILLFLLLLANDFRRSELLLSASILGIALLDAISTYFALLHLRKRRNRRNKKWSAILLSQYNSMMLLLSGLITFKLAIDTAGDLPEFTVPIQSGVILIFSGAILFALISSPSSIPRTQQEVQNGQANLKYLPYALAIQGAAVSIGTFLSAWILHGTGGMGLVFVTGIMTLLSTLLVFFSVLGFWRFVMLMVTKNRNQPS